MKPSTYHEACVKAFYDQAGWPGVLKQIGWVKEELSELLQSTDPANTLKEIADVQYTLAGLNYLARKLIAEKLVELQIGNSIAEEAFFLVHENNMSKIEGGVIRDEHGKIKKPAHYKPVNLAFLLGV